MWILTVAMALAGYGDAGDGWPSRAEREAHLWTNGVRITPAAFKKDYGCWDGFTQAERAPHAPLALHKGLLEVARLHSLDMAANGELSHESSNGTTFAARVGPYYPTPAIGENVAWGMPSAYDVVVEGWMCSDGHRENILRDEFVELGVGAAGTYWTQDFGSRNLDPRVLNMGVHLEPKPGSEVTLLVDVWEASGDAVAVLDGERLDMAPRTGGDGSGVYEVVAEVDTSSDCHLYWFEAGDVRFPEHGAYGFGRCAWDDEDAEWVARENISSVLPAAGDALDGEGGGKKGCVVAPVSAGWLGVGVALLAARRRRR